MIATRPAYAEQVTRMTALLHAEQELAGDELAWTANELHPVFVDFSGRERKADRHQPEWIRRKYFGE